MRSIIFFALVGLFAFFAYEAPEAVTPPSNVQGGIVAAEQNTVQAPAADGWLQAAGGVDGEPTSPSLSFADTEAGLRGPSEGDEDVEGEPTPLGEAELRGPGEGVGGGAIPVAPEGVIVEETEETVPEVVENEETEEPVAGEIEAGEPYVAPTLPEAVLVLENEEAAPEEQSASGEGEQSIVEQLINVSEPHQSTPQP